MKTKRDKNKEADKAVRLAESKIKTCERVAAADQKQAHTAKVKFKQAKKIWKQVRKKAKSSAKLAKLAQKNLATLEKHLKKMKKSQPSKIAKPALSSQAKKSSRPPKPLVVAVQDSPTKPAVGDSSISSGSDPLVS